MSTSYSPYYLKHIINNEKGLKPVIGGTGLGKTSGMIEAIKESIDKGVEKKFIYITNRHLLIGEVEKDLKAKSIPCVYLRSDHELLLELADPKQQVLKKTLYELAEKGFFKYDVQLEKKNQNEIREEIDFLIENVQNNYNQKSFKEGTRKRQNLDSALDELNRFIKRQFYKIKEYKNLLDTFLLDPNVWKLFPYIEFERNPHVKVLLGTIQKFCYGFFDGQRKRKLPYLKVYVIK